MSNLLHVCLYNTDPSASEELSAAIRSLNFVRLVREVATPEELAIAINEGAINLAFFHLDPKPGPVITVIEQVSERYPELALIAVSHQTGPTSILAPMRAGCDQFVCEPIDPADLATAVGRVASKRLFTQAKSRCICVTSASGGAGATSIACNLALEIANQADRECALIDLDLQFGGVALSFDREPKYSIYDLAVSGTELDHTLLSSTLARLPCNVAILARPELIEQRDAISPEAIHRVLEAMKASYENIVIDTPRDMGHTVAAAMVQAELILIVCQLLVPSIRNAERYYDALLRLGIPDERLQFVVNRSDGRSGRVTLKDLEATVKKPVFASVPNDYQFVAQSIDFGRPLAAADRNNPVRAAIRTMARNIVCQPQPASGGAAKRRRGFLSRLLAK